MRRVMLWRNVRVSLAAFLLLLLVLPHLSGLHWWEAGAIGALVATLAPPAYRTERK